VTAAGPPSGIVQCAVVGDIAALRERSRWLAREILPHEPALRGWLHRRPVLGLEVDDVIQETYAILATLSAVDHILSPRAYLFRTAMSLVRRHLQRARIVRIDAVDDIDLVGAPSNTASPEEDVAAREELRFVQHALAGLPPRCREVFLLRKLEGLSQREIARRVGISESTVEKHVARGLRILLSAIATSGFGDFRTGPARRQGAG
jgi:RNA polymerase sigma-70 factor (ECF subfamily)